MVLHPCKSLETKRAWKTVLLNRPQYLRKKEMITCQKQCSTLKTWVKLSRCSIRLMLQWRVQGKLETRSGILGENLISINSSKKVWSKLEGGTEPSREDGGMESLESIMRILRIQVFSFKNKKKLRIMLRNKSMSWTIQDSMVSNFFYDYEFRSENLIWNLKPIPN